MKTIILFILPFVLMAKSYSLKELVSHAHKNNNHLISKQLLVQAKAKEIEAQKSTFWPTLDIGASYTHTSPSSLFSPGDTNMIYANAKMDIYDGGRKKALLNAKRFAYSTSLFEKDAFKKSLTLNIIKHFYTIKKVEAMLFALKTQSFELKEQIRRIRKFVEAGMAGNEEIDKLQAVFDDNQYKIESSNLILLTSRERLNLLTGLNIKHLKKSYLKKPEDIKFQSSERSKILQANAKAINEKANALNAKYKPQVQIENSYSKMHYDDTETFSGISGDSFLDSHQNKTMLSVNMHIFDNGKIKKEREALQYQKMALSSEKLYAISEQKMNFRLAKNRLKSIRSKLKSAKSALIAAKSSYEVISKKYESGLLDNISYLDALNAVTLSMARHKETIYEYEIGKSILYYYAGKDPKEFIR